MLNPQILEKLKTIRLALFDCDGVMTDGKIIPVPSIGYLRQFHIHDGYGVRLLVEQKFPVGVITGGASDDLKMRMDKLGIPYQRYSNENKKESLLSIQKESGIPLEQISYMGDDEFDIEALQMVGLSIAPANAIDKVKKSVQWVTQRNGGEGAVREFIDALRVAQNLK